MKYFSSFFLGLYIYIISIISIALFVTSAIIDRSPSSEILNWFAVLNSLTIISGILISAFIGSVLFFLPKKEVIIGIKLFTVLGILIFSIATLLHINA